MAVAEIDITIYPKNLRMAHGNDGEREWWQWKRGVKAVAIQQLPKRKHPWTLYFVNGTDIEARVPGTLDACLDVLKVLGFAVKLGERSAY